MTLLSLLRRCLPAFGWRRSLTVVEQKRAAWGAAKVQIKPRRAALRRAS